MLIIYIYFFIQTIHTLVLCLYLFSLESIKTIIVNHVCALSPYTICVVVFNFYIPQDIRYLLLFDLKLKLFYHTAITGNSAHCLIMCTTMNSIDMSRIGRCIELPSDIIYQNKLFLKLSDYDLNKNFNCFGLNYIQLNLCIYC